MLLGKVPENNQQCMYAAVMQADTELYYRSVENVTVVAAVRIESGYVR